MRSVGIVQARLGSSRFPGKTLAPFRGTTVLGYQLDRLIAARRLSALVLAIPRGDRALADAVEDRPVKVFEGSEEDVLDRFHAAARDAHAEVVVRFTADCPMVDPALVDTMLERFEEEDLDYLGFGRNPTYPDGLGTEVFTRAALTRAYEEATDRPSREHVTWYVRTRPESFRIGVQRLEEDHGAVRLTLDHPEDLPILERVAARLEERAGRGFGVKDILDLCRDEPEIFGKNLRVAVRDAKGPAPINYGEEAG